jgi:hypothetical protein
MNDFLKLYSGLGAFNGLETPSPKNNITVLNKIAPNDPMKALKVKVEKLDLYQAHLKTTPDVERKRI